LAKDEKKSPQCTRGGGVTGLGQFGQFFAPVTYLEIMIFATSAKMCFFLLCHEKGNRVGIILVSFKEEKLWLETIHNN